MRGIHTSSLLSRVGCHVLGWINHQDIVLIRDSIRSFGGWINCSLTGFVGDGSSFPSVLDEAW